MFWRILLRLNVLIYSLRCNHYSKRSSFASQEGPDTLMLEYEMQEIVDSSNICGNRE